MPKESLDFYPPRAGTGQGLCSAWFRWRRRIAAIRLARFSGTTPAAHRAWIVLIPGYGIAVRGNPVVGSVALFLWGACGLVVLVYLGQAAGNVATAVMVGIHATGTVCALHREVFLSTRMSRIKAQFLAVLVLVLLIYCPAFWLVRGVAFPLHTQRELIIVNGLTFTSSLERGDVVGYRIRRIGGLGPVRVDAGYGLDPVIALPGDRVVFHQDSIEVNGETRRRLSHMPVSGELVIPDKHWFIWPVSIGVSGYHGEIASNLMKRTAVVPRSDIIGKPFTRWFWRKQEI